jgi:UDP-3-O-[3-hydroxymyristoyl] glucosamine N-acyltransferase
MALQGETLGIARQAYAHETITVDTAVGGTATNVTPTDASTKGKAQRLIVTANDQPARFTYTAGVTPTATVGHKLGIGETVVISGYVNILNFRIIKEGATNVNCALTYER